MKMEEPLNMIAAFMCAPINGDYGTGQNLFDNTKGVFPSNDKYISTHSLKYQKSWDWQIPVYSKLAKEIREIAAKEKNSIAPNIQHAQLAVEYQSAIMKNNCAKGFEIIVENLQWLQDQKK